ncbi:MAG: hypothetical protein MR510_08630 [Clostridium sp.]|nr:hypothetical protein [Clostridium sp.]
MKNFNWEEFKKGNIAVHCNTEEKAKDFLNECDKNDIKWETGEYTHESTEWNEHKKETSYSHYIKGVVIARLGLNKALGYKIIEWEIDTMKELTFTEVIANIKEGQVWESYYVAIYKKNGGISISFKEGKSYSMHTFSCSTKYKLQRKKYTFQEAFKAYEEGEEIESDFNCYKYKKINRIDMRLKYMGEEWEENFGGFDMLEIRGVWYIND